jgi:hypothetical protein
LAASADLIKSATRMRLRPGVPRSSRTVFAAVRLMYLGAAVELCTLITIVATLGSVESAVLRRNPDTAAHLHAELHGRVVALEVGAAIATGVWLWMAWANGRGHRWARVVFAVFFSITTASLGRGIAQNAAAYARADLIAGAVLWLVALATLALLFHKESRSHYARS